MPHSLKDKLIAQTFDSAAVISIQMCNLCVVIRTFWSNFFPPIHPIEQPHYQRLQIDAYPGLQQLDGMQICASEQWASSKNSLGWLRDRADVMAQERENTGTKQRKTNSAAVMKDACNTVITQVQELWLCSTTSASLWGFPEPNLNINIWIIKIWLIATLLFKQSLVSLYCIIIKMFVPTISKQWASLLWNVADEIIYCLISLHLWFHTV